jgi:hypothetical protein
VPVGGGVPVVPQTKEAKWNDRAAALDAAMEIMKKHAKIGGESRDYLDVVAALKLFLSDSHQAVRASTSVLWLEPLVLWLRSWSVRLMTSSWLLPLARFDCTRSC